ncbi:MAG: tRNA (guanosine(37)-N1)-methyltransferase TrmD [Candidatus Harrisonbacteria bacterium CG10_big_fil_rev_8_21_14_0_10_40_38]|uniref:tRNA (guanine-N(1)-)-methyltransferase n=1 Tax=Candidatus Harrisonbacteria bacterium CG10_big_fil_rev_8_21_14_0_10_40_38 TaxID=1974583 RepID=A0A2H0UV32_9BACT|nr:MAG: tRNA (guanosine(37)-N1)-methyltransferase TrmD [Candidatus Harrisonbacteria bacterium CG10_big_fil_rev_8_21_14_0_10_40_38]
MKKFHLLTIFPKMFDSYISESILKRAQEKRLISISAYDIRDFATDKHRKVDDTPYGGGPGMVLKVEPIFKAVNRIKAKSKKLKTRTILFSTRGKVFDAKIAKRLSKYDELILICGRYEGVDERVAKYIADEEISIGDFVLSGGELPAMIVVDAVSRFVSGVLGKHESLEEVKGSYKVYTKPEDFIVKGKGTRKKNWKVPKVLLSGDHKRIEEWRG